MSEDTYLSELLNRPMEAIEGARLLLGVLAFAVLLLLGGAKLERFLMKRQLAVLDGAAEGGDVDLTEGTGGGRS